MKQASFQRASRINHTLIGRIWACRTRVFLLFFLLAPAWADDGPTRLGVALFCAQAAGQADSLRCVPAGNRMHEEGRRWQWLGQQLRWRAGQRGLWQGGAVAAWDGFQGAQPDKALEGEWQLGGFVRYGALEGQWRQALQSEAPLWSLSLHQHGPDPWGGYWRASPRLSGFSAEWLCQRYALRDCQAEWAPGLAVHMRRPLSDRLALTLGADWQALPESARQADHVARDYIAGAALGLEWVMD